ncbi:MAG: efflux RND transporter periplasmic adaptor subunit, partial [Pseudomonadota bacterium]
GGKVQQVAVDIGDHVTKGQLLADLDKEPYKLDVQAAEADLASARSEYRNKKKQFQRVDELVKKGWASKSSWDAALAARDTARNQINFASSKLNLAKRDLRLTTLTAPFDGNIAARSVDPYVKVLPGQKLFEINADGTMDVELDIPETVIARIHLGMPVSVKFPTLQGETSEARVSFIGSAAGTANSFPVKADLLAPPAQIKPGMTADVDFILRDDNLATGYLVPLAAVAPGDDAAFGYVYIYNPDTSRVRKTPIEIPKDSAQNNMVQINKGVSAGDRIAVAGVSFLHDGQQVNLMQP